MSKPFLYREKILALLSKRSMRTGGFEEEIKTPKGKPIQRKVLINNLNNLEREGNIQRDGKYWKLGSGERTKEIRHLFSNYINSENSKLSLFPESYLAVVTKEAGDDLHLGGSRHMSSLFPYVMNFDFARPEKVAEELVVRRIDETKLTKFVEFYSKLVFLGFLLEREESVRKKNLVKEHRPEALLAVTKAMLNFEVPEDRKTGVPTRNPYIPTDFPEFERFSIKRFLDDLGHLRTIEELTRKLIERLRSDDYCAKTIFGFLAEEAAFHLGFSYVEKEGKFVQEEKVNAREIDEFTRRIIHGAMFNAFLSEKRHCRSQHLERERRLAHLETYASLTSFSETLHRKWSYKELKEDILKEREMREFLINRVLKPIDMIYIWSPFLSTKHVNSLEAPEIARLFDGWFDYLKAGNLDGRSWLFTGKVERALAIIIKGLTQNQKIEPKDIRIDHESFMQVSTLYKHHPQGKSPDFYSKIYREISKRKEAIEKRIIEEVPSKTNLSYFPLQSV